MATIWLVKDAGKLFESKFEIIWSEEELNDVGELLFGEGYGKKAKGTFENNGHSVQFTLDDPGEQTVSGGPLNATYALTQFHFHWGSTDDQGSEHTIDGKR